MSEIEITLGMALLLSAGLVFAKVCQLIGLPSVTGYILAGLALGPSCFGVISMESVGHRLEHFTQIALMLIAFSIGEHIELRRMGSFARDVGYICLLQALGVFFVVSAGTYLTSWLIAGEAVNHLETFILSLLLGSVALANAPATLLVITREMGARGVLTSTLMAVVAVGDGVAIMVFGMAVSISHQLVAPSDVALWPALYASVSEILFSLFIGVATGLLIDVILKKLHNRGEMLTAGLALLLLCGETTRYFDLSPLLAGMAAGFTIINRAERDVRLFRALNAFEPPIYVLFFTLAGLHLDLSALKLAGWIGLVYFVGRIVGKYYGAWFGAWMSGASDTVRRYLGLALLPQAGVAIGLVVLISSDKDLSAWSVVITPVVLAGVIFSELGGPLLARFAIEKAGEGEKIEPHPECGNRGIRACRLWLRSPEGVSLVPWSGDRIRPAANADGVVVFGAYHFSTVRGLARIATILAHHYHALPMSVRVLGKAEMDHYKPHEHESLFMPENDEVNSLGYPMKKELIFDSPAAGLVSAVEFSNTHAVVLGYPLGRNPRNFQRVLETVAANVSCPLVAVRFVGAFRSDRILVPFLSISQLEELMPVLEAMAMAVMPRITFLHLLHFDCTRDEVQAADSELQEWLTDNFFDIQTRHMVVASESRLEYILQEAAYHDLIIMSAARSHGFQKMFFGSLSDSVVQDCEKPVMVVYIPELE
ncbi:MAG: cation:proton antiporter [Desulfobulbaceae bacterium]|nr:cation:proton antiporter [Desulfobulbaceae bacterium]